MSDSEIIQCVLTGEKEAFSLLVKKYQNAVHGLAFHTTRNTHDAEDIAQEAFMEAFHRLPTLKEPAKFSGWLRAIANNLCVNWIRKKKSHKNLEEQLSNSLPSLPYSPQNWGEQGGSADEDTYEALMKVVNTLSEPNRIVIILKYLEGLSNLGIAEFLGISPSAVNVRIHRSLKQLQGKITRALEEGFKNKRLDESFAERVHRRIAERKPVTALTVKFGDTPDDQRAAIQQLIRNSNATVQENSLRIPPNPPPELGFRISEFGIKNIPRKGGTEVSAPEVKDRGDFSEDTLTVFYGVPTTRESDPIRAANTALAIQEQFREGTKIGIGLCFGTVELQNQQDGVETIVPTEQLMSRLSTLQAAVEEGIIADDLIYQLLETRYEFEEGECLRGEPPIYTYQLLSAHNLSSPTIPLIGRHAELELLKAEVEKVLLGGSSFILLTGEAGIGKTRLITELRAHYSEAPLFWLQGKCPPDGYFNYAPIVEALNAHFKSPLPPVSKEGRRSEMSKGGVGGDAHQLREELTRFGMERAIPYLADFLSLPIDDASTEAEAKKYQTATAEQIRYRTFTALRDWLTNMADIHPIVFVIEDFHWVDKPTLELLKYLTSLASEIPIMFIYIQRRWHENPFDELITAIYDAHSEGYQQINLNRLSREQSRRLLSQICSNLECANSVCAAKTKFSHSSTYTAKTKFSYSSTYTDIQRHILDRANGNPFYLEEMARASAMQSVGFSHRRSRIPHSIQSVVLSRVDQLDPIRKSVVQYAAVLGESFRPSILARLFPQVNMEKTLTMLTNSDFVQRTAESDLIQFKHSLIHEAILKSIAPTSRRQIHHEIAQTLEKFYHQQIEQFSAMLAHHYHLAGDGEKACEYAIKAAQYHARSLEYRKAARCYRIALEHESLLSDKERYNTYIQLGECLHILHQMEEAIAIYQKAEMLATDKTEHALVYIELADVYDNYIHDWTVDRKSAAMYCNKAAALVDEHTDTESIVQIFYHHSIIGTDNFMSELHRALEIIRGRNDERAEVKLLLAIAAHLYPHDAEKSRAYQQQALAIAQKIGDDSLIGNVFSDLAGIMLERDSRQALIFAQEALRWYEQVDDVLNVAYIHRVIGRTHSLLGNTEEAIAAYEQMLKFDGLFDVWFLGTECLGSLVQNYVQRGDWELARKMFFRMLNLVRKGPNKAQTQVLESAVASLCYGGALKDSSWMRKNISATIERGCEFVADLERRGVYATEMEELSLMHPILAATYLMHYSQKPLEEAVEGLKLFIRNIESLDEHVEYWAYALANIDSEKLERMLEIVVEQAASLFDVEQASCLPLAPWLQATFYEHTERQKTGRHLARVGIIAEPCWAVLGPFDSDKFNTDFEERLLKAVFDVERTASSLVEQTVSLLKAGELTEFPWREANDNLMDGYVDCVKVMNSVDEVYGYALTVIESPSERRIQIRIGYDDYITVWLNGEKLLETTGGSPCIYDDVTIDATLQPGQNRLLVKISNIEPGWGFLIRITDENGDAFDDLSYVSPIV